MADLIIKALQQAGVVDASIEPTAIELSEGLETYNEMVSAMRGDQIGCKLSPRLLTANVQAYNGTGYQVTNGGTYTVLTPANPKAGSRFRVVATNGSVIVSPSGYLLENSTAAITVSTGSRAWFFEDGAGNWVREQDALATDAVVYSRNIHQSLVDCLAVRLTDEYGLQSTDILKAMYTSALSRIAGRYGSKARNRVI